MIDTKFSEKELTIICQLLKRHGTDCATLVDVLKVANLVGPNDAISTFKHVRLLKEFGILNDRNILCHTCVGEVFQHHANTCEEYKERMASDYPVACPDEHYNFSIASPAEWMVDSHAIYRLMEKAAKKFWEEGIRNDISIERGDPIVENGNVIGFEKDRPYFTHTGRTKWLEEMFPDIDEETRFSPGFLCERHIGSMRPYANRIIGYR